MVLEAGGQGGHPAQNEAVRVARDTAELLDDGVLLEELRKGSPEAVEALFDRFHGKIFGLAMSILKNESDAEERASRQSRAHFSDLVGFSLQNFLFPGSGQGRGATRSPVSKSEAGWVVHPAMAHPRTAEDLPGGQVGRRVFMARRHE